MLERLSHPALRVAAVGIVAMVLGAACQHASRASAAPGTPSGADAIEERTRGALDAPASGAESSHGAAPIDPSLERLLSSLPTPPEGAAPERAPERPYASLPPPPVTSSPPSHSAWASDVVHALRAVRIEGGVEGELHFRLTVCKDGRTRVHEAPGSTLSPADRERVLRAFESLTLPQVPDDVASKMPQDCAQLRYPFVWDAGHVR